MTNMHTFARLRQILALLLGLTLSISAAHAGETVTYYHTDALGTPVMESNSAGQVTYAREYKPFGKQALGEAKNGVGFTGHIEDASTGLTYMQARYYDPISSRFLSIDPVPVDINSGHNYNRYWYANNAPYRFTDPDGRKARAADPCGWCDTFVAGDDGGGGERNASAEKKSLEGAPKGAAASDSTTRINNAIEAARDRVDDSGDQKTIDAWNRTTWQWDPDNEHFTKRSDLAAFVNPSEPNVIHVGKRFAEFYDRTESVYQNARFPGGDLGLQFVALHEFAHVFTAGQGTPGPDRERLANKTAYLWMTRANRSNIKCRDCRE